MSVLTRLSVFLALTASTAAIACNNSCDDSGCCVTGTKKSGVSLKVYVPSMDIGLPQTTFTELPDDIGGVGGFCWGVQSQNEDMKDTMAHAIAGLIRQMDQSIEHSANIYQRPDGTVYTGEVTHGDACGVLPPYPSREMSPGDVMIGSVHNHPSNCAGSHFHSVAPSPNDLIIERNMAANFGNIGNYSIYLIGSDGVLREFDLADLQGQDSVGGADARHVIDAQNRCSGGI